MGMAFIGAGRIVAPEPEQGNWNPLQHGEARDMLTPRPNLVIYSSRNALQPLLPAV